MIIYGGKLDNKINGCCILICKSMFQKICMDLECLILSYIFNKSVPKFYFKVYAFYTLVYTLNVF